MATTTNFGWETPDDTDLVKDGAAAIRTALGGVDTSFVDLKGGTTGQVLAKASGTDLDFSWVAVDPLTILDAKGDLITATAADTPARLAVGTNGQTLVADSSTATGLKWATAGSASSILAYTQVTAGNSTTSSTYQDVTSATVTFTAPASGAVKLTIEASMWATGGNQDMFVAFREGSTTIIERTTGSITSASQYRRTISGVVTGVSAGSHTYKISIKSTNATYTTGIASIAASPVFLTVEAAS